MPYPEGAQIFRGREGLKRWVASTKETWDEWRFEPERFLHAGDQVVALVRVVARGVRAASVSTGRPRTCGRSETAA